MTDLDTMLRDALVKGNKVADALSVRKNGSWLSNEEALLRDWDAFAMPLCRRLAAEGHKPLWDSPKRAAKSQTMTRAAIEQWIAACNYERARQVLREYLVMTEEPVHERRMVEAPHYAGGQLYPESDDAFIENNRAAVLRFLAIRTGEETGQ